MNDKLKKQIEEIIGGIGSPYGEGATYEGKGAYEYSHIDKEGRELLFKDLEALILKLQSETRERTIDNVFNRLHMEIQSEGNKYGNWHLNSGDLRNIKAELEELKKG